MQTAIHSALPRAGASKGIASTAKAASVRRVDLDPVDGLRVEGSSHAAWLNAAVALRLAAVMLTTAPEQTDRFRFGENWCSYAELIEDGQIAEAELSLKRLLQRDDLTGARFLDIRCGSGLFSLAARNIGASVRSFDFDSEAVDCTKAVKARFRGDDQQWTIEQGSILDPDYIERLGTFDIVNAWGVLHHTGDMRGAIRNAASLTAPNGMLAMALYRKTALCRLWAIERRWYAKTSPSTQKAARLVYVAAMRTKFFLTARDFNRYVANYRLSTRAMDYYYDVHDWLGGYPYEPISPDGLMSLAGELSLSHVRSTCHRQLIGLFGSGCD